MCFHLFFLLEEVVKVAPPPCLINFYLVAQVDYNIYPIVESDLGGEVAPA